MSDEEKAHYIRQRSRIYKIPESVLRVLRGVLQINVFKEVEPKDLPPETGKKSIETSPARPVEKSNPSS